MSMTSPWNENYVVGSGIACVSRYSDQCLTLDGGDNSTAEVHCSARVWTVVNGRVSSVCATPPRHPSGGLRPRGRARPPPTAHARAMPNRRLPRRPPPVGLLRPHLPPVGATHPAARRPFCARRSRYAASPFAADAPRHHSSRRSRMRLPPLPSSATVGAILPSACASTRQHPVRPPVPHPRSSPPPPRPTPPHPPFFPLASTPSLSPLSLSSLPVLLGGLPPSCLSSPPPPLRRRYGRWNDGCLCALRTAGR